MQLINSMQAMSYALKLAEYGRKTVSPNPLVGCVLLKKGCVVGHGFHRNAGGPHAEICALHMAGVLAKQATAYITLEPCCHYGLTPPCTEALIKAGIRAVYIACQDPNPLVNGRGIAALRAAGLRVRLGLCAREAKQLNECFFHYTQYQRPFVTLKWAMSLDGKTITSASDSPRLSCAASYDHLHELRQVVDAILIGANTARSDNPQLSARPRNLQSSASQYAVKQPLRVILSTAGWNLPLHLAVFNTPSISKTLLVTTDAIDPTYKEALLKRSVDVWIFPKNHLGQVDLLLLLYRLAQHKITSLLVEGGMTVHHHFFQQDLANKILVYLSPMIIGDNARKRILPNTTIVQQGEDWRIAATMMTGPLS